MYLYLKFLLWAGRLILVLTLLVSTTVNAAGETKPSVIILFGDSITTGYNLEENFTTDLGLGQTVQQLPGSRPTFEMDAILNNNNNRRTSVVVNWGEGGTNTVRGVNRITSSLQTTKNQIDGKNYYVLILYGTNDIATMSITSADTAFNIKVMINAVRAQGANFIPVVANLLPRSDQAVEPYNAQIVPAVQASGTSLVRLYEAFVNYPTGYQSLLGLERSIFTGQFLRLHPNVTGYRVIAQNRFDQALKNLIEPDPLRSTVINPILMLLLEDDPAP